MNFDLTDLRLFLHVAITAGAARSGLALASASTRIRAMAERAGVPLLDRGRRGVEPTPAGRTLLHHARLVTEQVQRMRGELGEYARGLKGHVRLLANTAAAAEFLPELLAAFLVANPSVDVDLDERPSTEVTQAIAEGRAEIGVAADHANLSGLAVMPFRPDRLILVVPRAHPPAARKQSPSPRRWAANSWVFPARARSASTWRVMRLEPGCRCEHVSEYEAWTRPAAWWHLAQVLLSSLRPRRGAGAEMARLPSCRSRIPGPNAAC